MIPFLTLLALPPPKADPDIAALKQAYAQAQKCDWETDDGQRKVWEIMGAGLAKVMADWPLQKLSYKQLQIRIERAGVQAGIVDKENFPKRSLLSTRGFQFARVNSSVDGIVAYFVIDRSSRLDQSDSAALLFIHGNRREAKVETLRIGGDETLPMPCEAVQTLDGLLLSGISDWIGNGPKASLSYYMCDSNRWRVVSEKVASFQTCETMKLEVDRRNSAQFTDIVEGRTYPKHLSVPHVMANVAMRVQFHFNGKYIHKREWRASNPMAVLDDLVVAIARDDRKAVSALCMRSKDVATLMNYKQVARTTPDVHNMSSVCSVDDHVFEIPAMGYRFTFAKVGTNWRLAKLKRLPKEN